MPHTNEKIFNPRRLAGHSPARWIMAIAVLATGVYFGGGTFLGGSLAGGSLPAHAQEVPTLSEGRLSISPFIFDETVVAGEQITRSIDIYNLSDEPLPLTVSINDFEPVGTHGNVRFFPAGEQASPDRSLASWIFITDQPDFTIPPKGITNLKFTITPPENVEPGTHYGGLLFSYRDSGNDPHNTTIIRKIGAIILARSGRAQEAGRLTQLTPAKKVFTEPDIQLFSSFENTGNVHLKPKGKVQIKNIFGQIVGLAYINENAQNVLPHFSRDFESSLHKSFLFGRYTAEASVLFGYGNPKLESKAVVSFWVFPIRQLGLGLGFALAAFLVLYYGIRGYNKWIIKRNP